MALISTSKIVYIPQDQSKSVLDSRLHAPVRQMAMKSPVQLRGQVVRDGKDLEPLIGTVVESCTAYIVVSAKKLSQIPLVPAIGDRVSEIAGVTEDLYVVKIQPFAHLGGRAQCLKLYLKDRRPVQ